jgi:hypothetical protein
VRNFGRLVYNADVSILWHARSAIDSYVDIKSEDWILPPTSLQSRHFGLQFILRDWPALSSVVISCSSGPLLSLGGLLPVLVL